MRIHITHVTRYRFDEPVAYGLQQLRKTPKDGHNQTILNWSTRVEGGRKHVQYEDHHNNTVELIGFDRDATELSVVSEGEVDLTDTHGVVGSHRGPSPLFLYQRATPRTQARAGVRTILRGLSEEDSLPRLHELSAAIRETVAYEKGHSEIRWTAEDAIEAGRGVCQDHTHIFIACARADGMPARYVSGYLMMNDTVAQEAMHAWAEAYVEGLGWVGFDISNGLSPDTRYVRVATGLDYSDAAPVSGTRIGGNGESLHVEINVAQQ